MNEYRVGRLAEDDIADIWNYIADDNPDAAKRMIDLFFTKFESPGARNSLAETCVSSRLRTTRSSIAQQKAASKSPESSTLPVTTRCSVLAN